MATITDISRATGLARTTVAEVLRGKAGYSATSQQRVWEAAKRLGYRPNFLGKALGGGKSMSVAAIWPFRGITGDIDVGMSLLEQAQRTGYVTYQTEFRYDPAWLRQAMQEFSARRVDALIVWSDAIRLRAVLEEVKAFPIVVAITNEPVDGFPGDLLIHDRYRAIEQTVDHFVRTGRRRPMMLVRGSQAEQGKAAVFLDRCRHHGLPVDERSLITQFPAGGPEEVAPFFEGFATHFRDGIDADALLCGSDQSAMVATRFLHDYGRHVPDDVAVVGWNNMPINALWQPALASVDRSHAQVIPAMRQMLFTRLAQPDLAPRRQVVHFQFAWRASAGGSPPPPNTAIAPFQENSQP